MQAHRIGVATSHRGYLLANLHVLTVIDHHFVIMGIGADVILTVFNHDQITVAAELITDVHHFTGPCRIDRLAARAGNINPLITAII